MSSGTTGIGIEVNEAGKERQPIKAYLCQVSFSWGWVILSSLEKSAKVISNLHSHVAKF